MTLSLSYLRPALIVVSLLTALGFIQFTLYNFDNATYNPSIPWGRLGSGAKEKRPNLLHPPPRLRTPLTIVTAASENHLCALEAFLYDIDRVYAQMGFDRKQALASSLESKQGDGVDDDDGAGSGLESKARGRSRRMRIKSLKRLEERIRNGQRYIESSADLAFLRQHTKSDRHRPNQGKGSGRKRVHSKEDGAEARIQKRQDEEEDEQEERDADDEDEDDAEDEGALDQDVELNDDDGEDEVWPRLIVYNMGMGIKLRKLRRFQALIQAGYIDELYDFDFDKHPDFWRLGTATRGQYGWKAGIQEEVSQRMLAQDQNKVQAKIDHMPASANARLGKSKVLPLDLAKNSSSGPEDLFSSSSHPQTRDAPQEQQASKQHQPQILLWLDSGDRISLPMLRWLPTSFSLRQLGVWSPQSPDTLHKWTHPGLAEYFDDSLDKFEPDETNCNGAVIAWDLNHRGVRSINYHRDQTLSGNNLFLDWIACAKDEACIAPQGSSRSNHRQDQAALTYLIKKQFNITTTPVHESQDRICFGLPDQFGMLANQDKYCKESIERDPSHIISD
ncbi:hypothetical protein EMPS_10564 [Entomortierella parvispora]|uniref:Uncharacterized protein n=1 Tax=Entomortierella parvispora TaxID=205924 RepID=A0A9P3M1N1_9FUNG|nr:hypothetical protein EMPS_10564 [Entomortierella parvispora]